MIVKLQVAWAARLKLRAEGNKLRAEGDKLWAEGDKFRAEGNKLRAEGNKLRAEGDKLWVEAVIEVHGNITREWKWREKTKSFACELGTGEVFEPDAVTESA